MAIEDLIPERLEFVKQLRERGEEPYPYSYPVDSDTERINGTGDQLAPGEGSGEVVSLGGRVMSARSMGKITFLTLQDVHGQVQVMARQTGMGKEYNQLQEASVGDIIGVKGEVCKTKRGETSVDVKEYSLLTKALRNFPAKFHGLKDKELRYRQRSLDLIVNADVKEVFLKRSKAISLMRQHLDSKGFVEVEVPTLQTIYGGAAARPFTTRLNALGLPLYLSISPELYLKRLIVGGIDRNYTLCKNFRNEGIDQTHNPEFTMMECYQAFADYDDMMKLTEDIYEDIFAQVNGKTTINYHGHELEFKAPWKRQTMYDAIKESTGMDVSQMTKEEIAKRIVQAGMDKIPYVSDEESRGDLVMELFGQYVEDSLVGPVFITDHPKESTPLCKGHRQYPELIERFEPFICGMEIGNAYSELNDPVLQRELFAEQAKQLADGNEEAHPMDEDFCRALEYGMPPTGGLGLGIDRMVMLLTEQYSIRDVILFPFMRPER